MQIRSARTIGSRRELQRRLHRAGGCLAGIDTSSLPAQGVLAKSTHLAEQTLYASVRRFAAPSLIARGAWRNEMSKPPSRQQKATLTLALATPHNTAHGRSRPSSSCSSQTQSSLLPLLQHNSSLWPFRIGSSTRVSQSGIPFICLRQFSMTLSRVNVCHPSLPVAKSITGMGNSTLASKAGQRIVIESGISPPSSRLKKDAGRSASSQPNYRRHTITSTSSRPPSTCSWSGAGIGSSPSLGCKTTSDFGIRTRESADIANKLTCPFARISKFSWTQAGEG